MTRGLALTAALLLGVSTSALAQSPASINAAPPPPVATTPPAQAAANMQAVLDVLAALGPKPIETLTPVQAAFSRARPMPPPSCLCMDGTAPALKAAANDIVPVVEHPIETLRMM